MQMAVHGRAELAGGRAFGCCVLGGNEEFSGVLPFTRCSSYSIRACNAAFSASNRRMIACTPAADEQSLPP